MSTNASGTTTQPTRQPVIDQYFEKLLTTNASGSWSRIDAAGAWYVMPW